MYFIFVKYFIVLKNRQRRNKKSKIELFFSNTWTKEGKKSIYRNKNYKMISPFHEVSGPQKYGDIEYEWRSLLKTPCYGFNGPNACYSSTCDHNPPSSNVEKFSNKTKFLFKSQKNTRKSFNCERATDYLVNKSASLKSNISMQMSTFNYSKKKSFHDFKYIPYG